MSDYNFTVQERFAVYTVHNGTCYLCKTPLDLKSMEVDHILPENLLKKPDEMTEIFHSFGLAETFDINDFGNWLPACRDCNGRKSVVVFEPTPIIQVQLERAQKYSEKAREIAEKVVSQRRVSRALNILQQAAEANILSPEDIERIVSCYKKAKRDAEIYRHENPIGDDRELVTKSATLLQLTPLYSIVSEGSGYKMVKAPYGVGYVPNQSRPNPSFYCGHCGSLGPWNGALCTSCGRLDDGD